ncbi:MAG: tetratricopeptide repeat protein, partial [Anaerolinea sp.]|nr:tetratricopeptide repeat protein [Anaerolinea sp.]
MAEQGLDMDDLDELTAVAATAVAADIEPEEPPVIAAEIAPEPPAALEPVTAPEVEAVIPLRAATAADAFSMLETDELVFPEDAMFPRDVGAPTDVPEELDSSMGDWLADLMAEQGLDMDDLTAVAATAVAEVEAEPTETISPVEWVTETEPEPPLAMAETPETDTTVIAEVAEPVLELFAEVDSSLDWLDDFSELVELDFDEETPPISAAKAETTPRAAIDPFAAVATRLDAEISRITGESASELEDTLFADSEINMDAELAESWPEWLSNDDDEQPGLGETGWLRTLAEPDVAGWLAAEEEGPDEQLFSSADVDFGKMGAIAPAAFDVGPLPEPESGSVADLSDPRITVPILTVNPDELDMARKAMTAGNYTRAVHAYQTLVESGQGLSILIADLETAAHRTPRQPTVRRLLGDAYMRNGQLQKALDTYRQALDLL